MTWPKVFDGVGAVVVRCDIDPEQLVDKIERHSGVGVLSWIAPKVTGPDITPRADIIHCISVWRALGLAVGGWIYNLEPANDVSSLSPWLSEVDFVIYDVEAPYKEDETPSGYAKAAQLVARTPTDWVVAVTSYGAIPGYGTQPSSIDFASFARAGWPILAQCYDSFHDGDELTYLTSHGGVYQDGGVHRLVRRLNLSPGESVYRPEGIDG